MHFTLISGSVVEQFSKPQRWHRRSPNRGQTPSYHSRRVLAALLVAAAVSSRRSSFLPTPHRLYYDSRVRGSRHTSVNSAETQAFGTIALAVAPRRRQLSISRIDLPHGLEKIALGVGEAKLSRTKPILKMGPFKHADSGSRQGSPSADLAHYGALSENALERIAKLSHRRSGAFES